jgi:phosphoglucomutase
MGGIRFGTDGWRARMGHDFTFQKVRTFAQAYANFLHKTCRAKEPTVLIDHDTRYLSPEFARETARVLSLNQVRVLLPDRDAPVPAASLAIVQRKLQGGICFTASFNDPGTNGIKVFSERGVPELPSRTLAMENEVRRIGAGFVFPPRYPDGRLIETVDVAAPYRAYIENLIDFGLIARSGLRIIVDNLYGTSRDYLDKLLADHDTDVTAIHNYSDSHFGGVIPSCSRENLRELAALVVEKKANLGLSTDADGDRFGVIDGNGRFIDSNRIVPPLLEYLIGVRHVGGDIVKSVSTTGQVNRVADHYRRRVYETPVGFKYLADMLFSRPAFLGVESTNGAALKGETAMKDGILFSLLIAEMVAYEGSDLPSVLKRFHRRYPRLFSREIQLPATPRRLERFARLLERREIRWHDLPPPQTFSGLDGLKITFGESWLLLRPSGTKGVLRVYAEARDFREAGRLIKAGRALVE